MKKKIWLVIVPILFAVLLLSVFITLYHYQHAPEEERIVDVLLYSDRGTSDRCVQATEKMFQWMNLTVKLVNTDEINTMNLSKYRILCMPGGDMYVYSQDISSQGKENIKNFITKGGGYIGICGGAYFACQQVVWQGSRLPMTPLGLLLGTAEGPVNEVTPRSNYKMCEVNIVCSTHPITLSEPDALWMLYHSGPALTLEGKQNVSILGKYCQTNKTMMLAFEYGLGRVFLIGTHPEFEEDNDRDGVTYYDELDDQGSDWNLMRKAAFWIMKEPIT
jgi:glutamine amidotransferase-like uncharacterized protein